MRLFMTLNINDNLRLQQRNRCPFPTKGIEMDAITTLLILQYSSSDIDWDHIKDENALARFILVNC